jgi:hypothetical protein
MPEYFKKNYILFFIKILFICYFFISLPICKKKDLSKNQIPRIDIAEEKKFLTPPEKSGHPIVGLWVADNQKLIKVFREKMFNKEYFDKNREMAWEDRILNTDFFLKVKNDQTIISKMYLSDGRIKEEFGNWEERKKSKWKTYTAKFGKANGKFTLHSSKKHQKILKYADKTKEIIAYPVTSLPADLIERMIDFNHVNFGDE